MVDLLRDLQRGDPEGPDRPRALLHVSRPELVTLIRRLEAAEIDNDRVFRRTSNQRRTSPPYAADGVVNLRQDHSRRHPYRRLYRSDSSSSARRSQDSIAPDSIPDSSIPSRSSIDSNSEVEKIVVLPSCSVNVTVSTTMWPGMPSNSKV